MSIIGNPRRWGIGIAAGLYLYYLLPATAVLFYELYHLTGLDFIYWGYSAFKLGDYYFGLSGYKLVTCVLVTLGIGILPGVFTVGGRA